MFVYVCVLTVCNDRADQLTNEKSLILARMKTFVCACKIWFTLGGQVEGVAARRGYHSSTEQTFDRILSTLLVEMDGVSQK